MSNAEYLLRLGMKRDLLEAVVRLLAHPEVREQMGRNGRAFVEGTFGLERVRNRYQGALHYTASVKGGKDVSGMTAPVKENPSRKVRVAIVAPSLRYVGGQSAQADLLLRLWRDDPDVDVKMIEVDPPLPRLLNWAEEIPGLRTILREPIYFYHLWRGLRGVDVAHAFAASYWSFLLAPSVAWLASRLRGKKILINYHSGEGRDHLRRFRSGKFVLSHSDAIVTPSGYLVDVFREFGLKATAVPNLVDLSQFNYRERNPLRPHLVCTRGFHRYYCVDVVVRAFCRRAESLSRSSA
jgi:glycosyltransferase involved in cell wall biosynthesis